MEISPAGVNQIQYREQHLKSALHNAFTSQATRWGQSSGTREYKRSDHLWSRFGKFAVQILKHIGICGTDSIPVVVFKIQKVGSVYQLTLEDVYIETEGVDLSSAFPKLKEHRYGVIGYDTEFLSDNQQLLSHQFCFSTTEGQQFAIGIDTDIRFTDKTFLMFISSIVQSCWSDSYKDWYLYAHFSLVEGSYVDSSDNPIIEREKKQWKNCMELFRLKRKTSKGRDSYTNVVVDEETGEKEKQPIYNKVAIHFCDSLNLDPRSLSAGAEAAGLEKYAVLPLKYRNEPWFRKCCGRVYDKMDAWKQRRSFEFWRYGCRDSMITAGMHLAFHAKFGGKPQTRTAKYSEQHFADFYREKFKGVRKNWQTLLGQVYTWHREDENTIYKRWVPNKFQQRIVLGEGLYKGGRNEAKTVGAFEGKIIYWDMTSAYPTALAAMPFDFDYANVIVRNRAEGAEERVKQLMKHGPFQPHAVKAYIKFKDSCRAPMAPVSDESGIIYPLETDGQYICWPEYWTAKQLGIIESEFILSMHEYVPLKTRHLPDHILYMMEKRNTDKMLYKNLLNYMTGKFSQGADLRKPFSSISCPAMAAYVTSVTRAAAAELANRNTYLAITTDGFISHIEDLDIPENGINTRLTEILEPINFVWLKQDFVGDQCITWKTRGYTLVDSTQPPTAPASKRFKQAKMGLQAEHPADFLQQIKAGKGIRKTASSFDTLDEGEIFQFMHKQFDVNPVFDWKYVVLENTLQQRTIEVDGVSITVNSFETRPLRSFTEYLTLRQISRRMTERNLRQKNFKEFSTQNYKALLLTNLLNDQRCRHIVWEFKKRLAREAKFGTTTMHHKTWQSLVNKPLYPTPKKYGPVRRFIPLLEKEVEVVKNQEYRWILLNNLIIEMEKDRE